VHVCEGEPMVAAGWKEATVVVPLKKEARFRKSLRGHSRYPHQFHFSVVFIVSLETHELIPRSL